MGYSDPPNEDSRCLSKEFMDARMKTARDTANKQAIAAGRAVSLTEDELRTAIQYRASGECKCTCGKDYKDHPGVVEAYFLTRICNGDLVKL